MDLITDPSQYIVRVNWYHSVDVDYNYDKFNEVYIRVVEHFGLPNDERYNCNFYEGYVVFTFNDSKDALVCKLLLSDFL